jgi:hypothetical protein
VTLYKISELAFKGVSDAGVKCASRLAQERAMGGVLHEGMLEKINDIRRLSLPEQQAGCEETIKRGTKLRLRLARHCG